MSDPKTDLQIDENQLDREWLDQPRLYFSYAREEADARRDWDAAKNSLELIRAETDQTIRDDPSRYGLGKTTEATIASAVVIQQEYQDAQEKANQARHRFDVCHAMVVALDHRKRALEHLVTLFMANYFSKPKARQGTEEQMDKVEKRAVRGGGRKR